MSDDKLIIGKENVSERNHSMDLLRVVACLGVIVFHMSSSVTVLGFVEKGSFDWSFWQAIDRLFKWAVPIFAMITGFFFLNPEKELTLKKLFGKNILHLVLVLVFWTWFYAVTLHCLYTCYYPFGGQNTNFWYIGMCIGLYISMPVLRCVAADDKLLAYSCWIWLFIRIYCYIGYYVDVPIVFTDYVFTGYVGYCLWGYYLSRIKLDKKQTNAFYVVGLLSLVVTVTLPLLTKWEMVVDFESPGPILFCIALFLFVIKHPIQSSSRMTRIVEHVSSMTLGIYMVHTFVVMETFTRIHRFIPNPYLLVLLAIVVVFGLSYLITLVIKQIPVLKKWVV